MEPAPGALDLLEFGSVQDFVDLDRQLLVELGDHLLDRVQNVIFDDAGIGERLTHQGRDCVLDFGRRSFGPRLEVLLQKSSKVIRIFCLNDRFFLGCFAFCRHNRPRAFPLTGQLWPDSSLDLSCAATRSRSACINSGSLNSFLIWSSAATLPSM